MARRKTSDDSPPLSADASVSDVAAVPLEQAMAELAEIASRLESGQESLDQSLARFERGMQLLRTCHQQLDQAAQRIEIVTRIGAAGVPETEPFDARATFPREQSRTVRPGTDDEGVLF